MSMDKLIVLLFSLILINSCNEAKPEPSIQRPSIERPASDPPVDLDPLIKEGRVKITKDGSLELISVFGPNQNQTTGTYDCWIHAPFNAWRLMEGDSIESFTGKNWKEKLVSEVEKYKIETGISGSLQSSPNICLSRAQILRPLADSPDFTSVDVEGANFGISSKLVKDVATDTSIPLDPPLIASLTYLTKVQYNYFSSNVAGKKELEDFQNYQQNCYEVLPPPAKDFNDHFRKQKQCIDALTEKNITNNALKTIVASYLLNKTPASIDTVYRYVTYKLIMSAFSDKIKRLHEGHFQVIVLGFQESPDEYPLDHAVAVKIMPYSADKIIVINSENTHVTANKTFKMLHHLFKLPLPEELK